MPSSGVVVSSPGEKPRSCIALAHDVVSDVWQACSSMSANCGYAARNEISPVANAAGAIVNVLVL